MPFLLSRMPENVSVVTHGHHEMLRQFQGSRHFAWDQRLRLETPVWRVLHFYGNPLCEDELEQQKGKFKKGLHVVPVFKHPFAENLIADGAGAVDPQSPVLTNVCCLLDALRVGGSYQLAKKLWVQFVLTGGRVNTQVAWNRGKVLVGSVIFRSQFVSFQIHNVVLLLVNHFNRNAAPKYGTHGWVGSSSPFVQFGIRGAWCDTVDLHANLEERHLSSGCRGRVRPFLQVCYARIVSAWLSCGCYGWFGVPCCCFWWVARVGWHLRRLFGQSGRSDAGWVTHLGFETPEAMPAKGVFFRIWIFRSIFHDGNHRHEVKASRALRLHDVTFRSSSCHCHRRAVHAVTSRGREQLRVCVASHVGLPQGDWEKDWRRHLNGIMHSPLLFQLQFLPYSLRLVLL